MEFGWDPAKSAGNSEKHGIDFATARRLWLDPARVEIPARTADEPRTLVIGQIDATHWSAVVTERGGKVRIISVRRSRAKEVAIYEG